MQCPGCQGEVLGWHFYCPDCRMQLRWTTGTSLMAYEIGKVELSDPPPSRKLPITLKAVAVSGVALAIIVTGISLSYRDANRHQNLTQNASVLTEPVALAEPVVNRLAARHAASTAAEQKPAEKADQPFAAESVPHEAQKPLAKPEPRAHDVQPDAPLIPQNAAPKSSATEAVKNVEINAELLNSAFDPRIGLLTIKSDTRARIYINGQFSGITPRTIRLLAGEHTITLSADGCDDWSRKIQLLGRQQMNIVAPLKKKAVTAQTDSSR